MKKYFTKYLTLEGEIKEGDSVYFIDDWYSKHKMPNLKVITIEGNIANLTYEGGCGSFDLSILKRHKLFLCSRNIQVNDKVIHEDSPFLGEKIIESIDERLVSFVNGGKTHDHNLIKIMGEISPEATWVKEDDEFDEDSVKYTARGNAAIYHKLTQKEFLSKYVGDALSYRIELKGSCGHFH